jgi:hypothetical protein
MNERIKELAEQASIVIPKDSEYNGHIYRNTIEKFAELIIRECSNRCGSQADQRNILKSFGFEVESNIKYTAPERNWSINSQYDREYNLPKGVTNDGVK